MYYNEELREIYVKLKTQNLPLTAFYKNPYYEYDNYYSRTLRSLRNSGIHTDEPDASIYDDEGNLHINVPKMYDDRTNKLVDFKYLPYQNEIYDILQMQDICIITGPKQTAKMVMIILHAMCNLLNKEKTPQIHTFLTIGDRTTDIMDIFLSLYTTIPYEAQLGIATMNKNSIYFENGSKLIVQKTIRGSIKRSDIDSYYYLYGAERLTFELIDKIYEDLMSFSSLKKFVLESNYDGLNSVYRFRCAHPEIYQYAVKYLPKNMSKEEIISEYKYYMDPLSDKYPRQLEDMTVHLNMRNKLIDLIKYEGLSAKDKGTLLAILDKM